jgi:hypothetical protein
MYSAAIIPPAHAGNVLLRVVMKTDPPGFKVAVSEEMNRSF